MYKVVYFLLDEGAGVGGASLATHFQCREEPAVAEKDVVGVGRFGYAVSVKEQGVAFFEIVCLRLVDGFFHGGHDKSGLALDKLDGTVAVADCGRVVACRCKIDMSRAQVDNACPDRNEHVQLVALCESEVGPVERIDDGLQVLGCGAQDDSCHHHEQGRGDSLSGHVANDNAKVVVVDLEEVVEVSADFLGGQQERSQFVAVVIGIFVMFAAGEHRKLNVAGKVQFALDALHVLLPFDVVLEFGQHVRECARKFGNLVASRYLRDGHVEVSAAEFASGYRKFLEGLGDSERNQQDNDEDDNVTANGKYQEQLAHGALVLQVFLDGPHDHEGPVVCLDGGVVNGGFFASGDGAYEQSAAVSGLTIEVNLAVAADFFYDDFAVPFPLGDAFGIGDGDILGRSDNGVTRVRNRNA